MSGNLPLFDAEGEAGLSPAAAVAAALLHSSAAPLAAAQLRRLWPSKPLPKPAALEAALEELAQRGAASRLPGRGGKPVWSARPLAAWLEDARQRILRAAGGSPQPVKEKDLLAAAGWPKELDPAPVRELLGRLEQEGALKRWPGKTPSWWRLGPEESLGEILLETLGAHAMSRAEWLRAARGRLKGAPAERWKQAADGLIAQGRVFQYLLPIDGKKVEACARAEHRAAFLELYRPMLDRLKDEWRRLGASEDQIRRFLIGGAPELEELLFSELKKLEQESPPPNPVSFWRARPALRGLRKEEFDRVALELFRQGRTYMAPHDHPMLLPEKERHGLVADGEGNYYVSVTARL